MALTAPAPPDATSAHPKIVLDGSLIRAPTGRHLDASVWKFAPEFHTRAQLRLDPNSIFLPGHQTVRMCGRHQSGRNSCAARHRHRQVAAAVSYARPGIRRSRRGFLQVAPLSWSPARAICRPMCRNTSISRSSLWFQCADVSPASSKIFTPSGLLQIWRLRRSRATSAIVQEQLELGLSDAAGFAAQPAGT